MTHRMACCCGGVDCSQWLECAPQQISFPRIFLERKQTTNSSAGLLVENVLEIEILDLVLVFDPGTGCYYPAAESDCVVNVNHAERTWFVFSGTFDVNLGHRCPDCQERCFSREWTFTSSAPLNTAFKSLCCVLPCGPNSTEPRIRLEWEDYVDGSLTLKIGDIDQAIQGRCVQTYEWEDEPWTVPYGFDIWLQNECMSVDTWKCRAVDFYRWDLGPGGVPPGFYNGSFFNGRIPNTVGGNPLNEICDGEYNYERPLCLPNELGNPVIPTLPCLTAKAWGARATHYAVTSCELNDRNQPGGSALCAQLTCIDSSKVGAQCCQRIIKTCMCDPTCDDYWCSGAPAICDGDVFCNTDGVLDFIVRTDELHSTFAQPTIP